MTDWKRKRVGVLLGGISSEREVSLESGKGVLGALLERGYDAVAVDWRTGADLAALLREHRIDVVWNALHGTYGEDGCVQGLLECLRIPYTGSGVMASAVAMDKVLSKQVFEDYGLKAIPGGVLKAGDDPTRLAMALGYPVVVKPSREGSSVGITIVKDESQIAGAVALAAKGHGATLFERFIPGREISVGVLDGEAVGTVEIVPKTEYYDYEAKYLRDDTEYRVPAPVPPAIEGALRDTAVRAYRAVECSGHARVDFRLDPTGTPWLLELNTLPGMTSHSLLPKMAAHAGIDFATLCERILAAATLHA